MTLPAFAQDRQASLLTGSVLALPWNEAKWVIEKKREFSQEMIGEVQSSAMKENESKATEKTWRVRTSFITDCAIQRSRFTNRARMRANCSCFFHSNYLKGLILSFTFPTRRVML